jgi:hypothetical protein
MLRDIVLPPWVKWAVLAAAALALYLLGRLDGERIEGAKFSAYVAEQASKVTQVAQARERVVTKVEIQYRDRIQIVREKGETIVKEVPVYVSAETDRRFPVPRGFVRVHDAAAAGEPAGAPAESDGEAAGVVASAAAETIAGNYAECRKWREQVIGWQDFYQQIKRTE